MKKLTGSNSTSPVLSYFNDKEITSDKLVKIDVKEGRNIIGSFIFINADGVLSHQSTSTYSAGRNLTPYDLDSAKNVAKKAFKI